LPRHSRRLGPLLHEPRLVDDQHSAALVAQVVHDVRAQLVAHGLRVPVGVGEEPLDPLWTRLAQPFGELPAILALHRGQQAVQIPPHPLAHLPPVEIAGDTPMYLVKRPHRSHRCQDLFSLPLVRCQALLCHVLTSPVLLGSLALPVNNRHCSIRGCYEPPIKLSSLGSKRQTKAAKCRPISVVGSRS